MVRVALCALVLMSIASPVVAAAPSRPGHSPDGVRSSADISRLPFAGPRAVFIDTIPADSGRPVIVVQAEQFPRYSFFLDPAPTVATKEFSMFYNGIPDTNIGPGRVRGMFHLIYQRSGGTQQAETAFAHAWSPDLVTWSVDTLAFTVDTTAWNSAHVWSPSLVHFAGKDYLFYTGVDAQEDQRIGYASTSRLDTSNTVWDPARVMVWEAPRTQWAVPDPWTYFGQTQFRDPFVIPDPDQPDRLLMFYAAHDSIDFRAGQGGLMVGVARSEPGNAGVWTDLGYYPSTHKKITKVGQLEGPHVFPVNGTSAGWRLMYSNAGTPPGERGNSTIRFESIVPGASLADTSLGSWQAPQVLKTYLGGDPTVFGWSGSEHLRVGGVDFLAGFTAWGPFDQGIAISRLQWLGDDFTLGQPTVSVVNEYRSPARGVQMRVLDDSRRAGRVTFELDSPLELEARLDVFDAQGRSVRSLLAGPLVRGRSSVHWDLTRRDGGAVASGMYFVRLSFAGGVRAAQIPVVR